MRHKLTCLSVLFLALLLSACDRDFFIPPDAPATPAAPTGLTVTPGEGSITLRWQDNSDDETGFAIFKQTMPTQGLNAQQDDGFAKLTTVAANTTQYEDKNVVPGTLYRYGVAAEGATKPSAVAEAEGGVPVPAENRAPGATAQKVNTQANKAVAVTLTGSDPDGDALTYKVVTQPTHGSLSGAAPNLTYTPNKDYSGPDGFTFTVSDGQATSAAATVSVTVSAVDKPPVNTAPVANDQVRSTPKGTPLTITLIGSDPEGDALTFAILRQPNKGSLGTVEQATGKVLYTPNATATGPDSFTFTVSDGKLTSAPATVTVNLDVVNAAPVAEAQTVQTDEDTAASITLTATDKDGDALTYSVVTGSGPTNGTLGGTAPNLIYTPNKDFNGSDSFKFKANDGSDDSSPATVNITVNAVNDAPSALTLSANSVAENEPAGTVVGSLSASDIDSSNFTYSLVAGTGDTDNASFTVDNVTDELKTARAFDYENVDDRSQSVRVQVSDGDLSFEKSFTITVTDVDDTLIVTTEADSGAGSLRQIVLDAVADDTITFASGVQTVTLTGGEIVLNKNLTIQGGVTINGNANSRIFNVSSGATVVLKDVTVTNGNSGGAYGGGLYNGGTLTLQGDASISGNTSTTHVGGVHNTGTLTLQNSSSITGNTTPGFVGGVFNQGTLVLQDDSSISNNTTGNEGGGVYNAGTVTLQDNSSISGNTAGNRGGGVMNYGTLTGADYVGSDVGNDGTYNIFGNTPDQVAP